MKKILIYVFGALFVYTSIFASCEDNDKEERIKVSKTYFKEIKIYSNVDSTDTHIRSYIGKVDGHAVTYHLYSGKNKSQMEVWHLKEDCEKCKKLNVK